MKKIAWLTAGCYVDTELAYLNELNKQFDIEWIVFANKNSYSYNTAIEYAKQYHIKITHVDALRKWYDPRYFIECKDLIKRVAGIKADIYYIDITTFPHVFLPLKYFLSKRKVVLAMHQGRAHKGMRFTWSYNIYLKWLRKRDYYFKFFSETQSNLFNSNPQRTYVIPLAVHDYGMSDRMPGETLQFLFFGHIISTKNIGLLIDAACRLKEQCGNCFKVKVVGNCRQWRRLYQPMIKYPEIFDLTIESVPDSKIPDIFCSSHYLMLPYSSVTQSGPLRIAYGYNIPVIASDLDGFKESIVTDITGLMFENGNTDALVSVMKRCVENHPQFYNELRAKQKEYVTQFLSIRSIVNQYEEMFNKIANE